MRPRAAHRPKRVTSRPQKTASVGPALSEMLAPDEQKRAIKAGRLLHP
jgi:hypothetical protein